MHNDTSADDTTEKEKPEVVLKYNAKQRLGSTPLNKWHVYLPQKGKQKDGLWLILELSTVCAHIVNRLKYPEVQPI